MKGKDGLAELESAKNAISILGGNAKRIMIILPCQTAKRELSL